MSKIVALNADEEQGKKPSIRQRRLLTRAGLHKAKRMTHLDALAEKLGYQLVRGTYVAFRHTVTVESVRKLPPAEVNFVPRVKKMTFTEACNISRDLSDSREERLMSASFDGPE
ncbi:TPA: hypothetical protein L2B26_005292 [Klebsiella oxytoca]|uniref:hypothetical protein n=1 Tax=Klebsiella oxytoca TaxID=571 RepID=UPI00115B6311|nr:hypothetical protein [Klebsiella oxytoca]HDX8852592.1 hypothetical protein [Klebsiella michiganensis]MDG9997008.1 hypothetical protein [Klebsiella oxytoca]MDU4363133.1 hypothetical protein [Klebsiella oxytoca]HBC7363695.1 hypothetical protein [Klebsiella oxytoca]HBM3043699.1 hypothetical protein [Klebsiella oxytoca]